MLALVIMISWCMYSSIRITHGTAMTQQLVVLLSCSPGEEICMSRCGYIIIITYIAKYSLIEQPLKA